MDATNSRAAVYLVQTVNLIEEKGTKMLRTCESLSPGLMILSTWAGIIVFSLQAGRFLICDQFSASTDNINSTVARNRLLTDSPIYDI